MDLPQTLFGSLFQCLTLFMGKKHILIPSLNLFSFSSCLLSHPPAVQLCEKSGFSFSVMSLQALEDAVKPIPKPCTVQAAAAQLVQPLLSGQVCPPWISWWSFLWSNFNIPMSLLKLLLIWFSSFGYLYGFLASSWDSRKKNGTEERQ